MFLGKILRIIDLILAIEIWLEELHLTAKSYSLHLLADRLSDDFAKHKDAIREVSISLLQQDEQVANAKRNLRSASNIINLIPDELKSEQEYLDYTMQLYTKLLEVATNTEAPVPLRKELDDLCAKLSRDMYLIQQNMRGE